MLLSGLSKNLKTPIVQKTFLIIFGLTTGLVYLQPAKPAQATGLGEFCANNNSSVATIDKFNTQTYKITDFQNFTAPKNFGTVLSATALGGELEVSHTADSPSANTDIAPFNNQNFFTVSNGADTKSKVLLIWDGIDASPNINYLGLGGVNLSQNQRRNLITFNYFADFVDSKPVILTFTLYTNAGKASKFTTSLYGEFSKVLNKTVTLSDFTPSAGLGADFTNIGAITLEIDATSRAGHDFGIGNISLPCLPDLPALVCSPQTQTANLNQTINFSAQGGTGNYTWSVPNGTPSVGNGQNFSTNFTTSGNKTVTVSSGEQTAVCSVQVNPPPPTACIANTNPIFTATPPLKTGNSYSGILSWASTGNNPVKITYTYSDNYNPTLLTTGNSVGTFTVPNLLPGKAYIFSLYDSACNVLLASVSIFPPNENFPPIIPVPPLPPVACLTNTPNIVANQTVNFFATGGNGNYTWQSANSSPGFGQGGTFSAWFAYPGQYTVSVNSNGQNAQCFVNVQAGIVPPSPVVIYQTPPAPQPQIAGVFTAPKTGAETNAFVFAGLLTFVFALYKKKSLLKKFIFE